MYQVLNMNNETLLLFFVAFTGAAVLLQAIILLAFFLTVRKTVTTQHVEFEEFSGSADRGYGYWPPAGLDSGFASRYDTPGWRRAEARSRASGESGSRTVRPSGATIEGAVNGHGSPSSIFRPGSRVMHSKFGPGEVIAVDGPKLTVDFDKAGRKLVMDSFIAAA